MAPRAHAIRAQHSRNRSHAPMLEYLHIGDGRELHWGVRRVLHFNLRSLDLSSQGAVTRTSCARPHLPSSSLYVPQRVTGETRCVPEGLVHLRFLQFFGVDYRSMYRAMDSQAPPPFSKGDRNTVIPLFTRHLRACCSVLTHFSVDFSTPLIYDQKLSDLLSCLPYKRSIRVFMLRHTTQSLQCTDEDLACLAEPRPRLRSVWLHFKPWGGAPTARGLAQGLSSFARRLPATIG